MEKTRLGRTGLEVTRTAFGALPIQRIPLEDAAYLLRKAYEAGVNFFDTARGYTDSEEKIGAALSDVRDHVIIATKSGAGDGATLTAHLETSLQKMRTDYVDILQLHNPAELPDPNDAKSTYAAAKKAQAAGKVRFIGISNHRLPVAHEAVRSGLFDTLQFPFSSLSSYEDVKLVKECGAADVGFIAMKAMAGGLIRNVRAAFAFLRQFENVVPIWGVQRESELDEFLSYAANPPAFTADLGAAVAEERKQLAGEFCRGCGYCLPCPQDIPINMAARMSLLIRRAPAKSFLTDEWRRDMFKIETCIECGECKSRCPYGLDTPNLLKKNLEDYRTFLK